MHADMIQENNLQVSYFEAWSRPMRCADRTSNRQSGINPLTPSGATWVQL